MARRSQCSSQTDNPLDPSYLEPHYKEYYRQAIDILAIDGEEKYYQFLDSNNFPDFLCAKEIEHIKKYLQKPQYQPNETTYMEPVLHIDDDEDGSSGTYWPLHSDIAAPELDLGWPMIRGFQGTSEVTTLVHPPPLDSPSIKEELRRMIKSARQVIGIVMDIFTDIDLFKDLLDAAARRVPVYVLLDEFHSNYFMEMVTKCKVNLGFVDYLRVRTVPGSTYFCRTGMSFKGHMTEKFVLVDCRIVLSGTYSFMWSFEKIHRSIAHVFHGELVNTFDEEFRILFAQSNPIIKVETALVKADNLYGVPQFGFNRNPLQRQQMLYLREDPGKLSQHSSSSFPELGDTDFGFPSFRRDDIMRHTLEVPTSRMMMHKYGTQFEPDKMQLNPSQSFIQAKRLEMEAFKRHSFAEGTFENYSTSRQFMQQRLIDSANEFEFQSSHFQREHHFQIERPFNLTRHTRSQGLFEKIKAGKYAVRNTEEFADDPRNTTDFHAIDYELPSVPFRPMLDYRAPLSSDSSKEVHGSGVGNPAEDGRFGQRSQKRQNMGQTYVCQISPTQKQNLDQRLLFQEPKQDKKPADNRHGLRSWRISSYLSSYQDESDEGIPGALGSEMPDDVIIPAESTRPSFEINSRIIKDIPQISVSNLIDSYSSKVLNVDKGKETLSSAEKESEEREPKEVTLIKHDSLRSRVNPMLQRSSRLRSSLIFNSSKLEQHISTQQDKSSLPHKDKAINEGDKATNEGENESESTTKVTSSTLADILERHRSLTRGSYLSKKFSDLTSKQEQSKSTEKLTDNIDSKPSLLKDLPHVSSSEQLSVNTLTENFDTKPSFRKDFLKSSVSQQVPENSLTEKLDSKPSLKDFASTSQQVSGNSNAANAVKSLIQEFEVMEATKNVITGKAEKTNIESKSLDVKGNKNLPNHEFKLDVAEPENKDFVVPLPPEKSTNTVSSGGITRSVTMRESASKQNEISSDSKFIRNRPVSASMSEKVTVGLTKNFGSTTSLNISKEETSNKEISALEKLRRDSVKFRHLASQKEEKKQDEPTPPAPVRSTSEDQSTKLCNDSQETAKSIRNRSQDDVTTKTEEKEDKLKQSPLITHVEEKEDKVKKSPPPVKSNPPSQNRFPSSSTNMLYGTNLRDDTKVILEQISANSQKNRSDASKQNQQTTTNEADDAKQSAISAASKEIATSEVIDSEKPSRPFSRYENLLNKNRYNKAGGASEERDDLIKKMDSIRKEKRVYSRFEVFYKNKDEDKGNEKDDDNQSDKLPKEKKSAKYALFTAT
ncbi:protein FAM83H isoform X2 [Protopterus annectens]|uniref:protein FAM83H isoform X2 n=1 Tax=Protopterus annectens TaxID=7888 RepID=UPI001CFAF6F4|nr:protein FAM83H isoform X2 [Protopterus annectens]